MPPPLRENGRNDILHNVNGTQGVSAVREAPEDKNKRETKK